MVGRKEEREGRVVRKRVKGSYVCMYIYMHAGWWSKGVQKGGREGEGRVREERGRECERERRDGKRGMGTYM